MKKREPFELVIHVDENGTRATASYRIRHYDEDDSTRLVATEMESVTLGALGDDFPWGEFVDTAAQAALLQSEAAIEARDKANSDLAHAKSELAATQEALAQLLNPIVLN